MHCKVSYSDFADAFVLHGMKDEPMPELPAVPAIAQLGLWFGNLNDRIARGIQQHCSHLAERAQVLPAIESVRYLDATLSGVAVPDVSRRKLERNANLVLSFIAVRRA